MYNRIIMMIAVLSTTAACGVAAKVNARNEYQASLTEYRSCLRTQPEQGACENLRKLVAVNERAFNAMAAGITGRNYSASTISSSGD